MSPEQFRRYGHELIDWLADYHESLADRPVMAKTRPGEIRDALPAQPPNEPEDFGAVTRGSQSHCPAGTVALAASALLRLLPRQRAPRRRSGRYLSTGLGVIGLSWQSSPAVTELEEVVTDWLRQMLGLSPAPAAA